MFEECNSLESLLLPKFIISNDKDNEDKDKLKEQLEEEKKKNLKLLDELNRQKNKMNKLMDTVKKSIAVIFISLDQNINYPITCNNLETFSSVEEKLYKEFPKLKKKDVYFLSNGIVIDRKITLEQNKIKGGSIILINYVEWIIKLLIFNLIIIKIIFFIIDLFIYINQK